MTLTRFPCYNRYGNHLFDLMLPTEFPVGTRFPYGQAIYRVTQHDFRPISDNEAKNLNPIVDLVLVVEKIETIWDQVWAENKTDGTKRFGRLDRLKKLVRARFGINGKA